MRVVISLALCGLAGCADLSRPHAIRISKDSGVPSRAAGAAANGPAAAVVPEGLVTIPGPDGKKIAVPRLNPPGHPNAGLPVQPGDEALGPRRRN